MAWATWLLWRNRAAEDARRARLILLLAEGHTWDAVSERIDCSRGFVASWSKRFTEQRIAGLYSRHLGQAATVLTPELEARILEATRHAPRGAATHWSTRKLGTHLDVSHMMVARVWRKHGLKCGLGEKTGKAWYQYKGLVPHDFRRSAVRNFVNAGVDTATAMKITGHRTLHIFMRYNIISIGQLHEAMEKVTSKKKAAK